MLELLSNEQKYYLIGFLQGDGHLAINEKKISIELAYRDKDIIDKLEKILAIFCEPKVRERTRNTNFKKDSRNIILEIHKKEFLLELSNYIPIGKKCLYIEPPPNMSREDKFHYIRGLVDADGAVGITSNNLPFWTLCTSSDKIVEFLVNDFKLELNKICDINRNKKGFYTVTLFIESAIEYADKMYKNATIYLDRKYEKYLLFNSWIRPRKKIDFERKKWQEYEDKLVLSEELTLEEKSKILNRTFRSINMRVWRLKSNKS